MINTERPNTVAGLVAKRAELVKLRDQLEAEARNVTVDTSSPQDGAADHLLLSSSATVGSSAPRRRA
jgi:hypothetical protein